MRSSSAARLRAFSVVCCARMAVAVAVEVEVIGGEEAEAVGEEGAVGVGGKRLLVAVSYCLSTKSATDGGRRINGLFAFDLIE